MSTRPLLFSLVLSLGLVANAAAPKPPKTPKIQTKKEAELTKCQEAAKSVTKISAANEIKSAAQCQFWVAEQGYAKFNALKLPKAYDKDKLKLWMEDSKKQREEASALYVKSTELSDKETTVAALARVGLMSYQFATSIQKAPLPTELETDTDGDGKVEIIKVKGDTKTKVQDAVKVELDKLAAPIFADAKTAFEKCSKEAKDNKIENEWSNLCDGYLLVLNPPAVEEKATKKEPAPANGLPIVEKKPGGVVKSQ